MIRNSKRTARKAAIRKLPAASSGDTRFQTLADGYYETDLQGHITVVNASLCQLLGCTDAAQLIGTLPGSFIDPATWAHLVGTARRVLETGSPAPLVKCSVTRADGTPRAFELSIALISGVGAAPTGFCGIVRDATGRSAVAGEDARLAASLQAQLIETQSLYVAVSELEQLKTHMLRVLAHDLRGPLSIITGYIELLNEDLAPHYNDVDAMYVNAIRQASTRILQLTSDILSLERLHEFTDISSSLVALGSLLERTAGDYAEETRQHRQELAVSAEPLTVHGDAPELREAIANLLSNAIKYTGSGGTITVSLRRDTDFALLEIADSGFGIPADQQEGLFQPFQRVNTRETYGIEGTGLGLYLVKRIVERHGGTVHFRSDYGAGSVFGFRLPLAKTDTPTTAGDA